jgi:hypothetical protein
VQNMAFWLAKWGFCSSTENSFRTDQHQMNGDRTKTHESTGKVMNRFLLLAKRNHLKITTVINPLSHCWFHIRIIATTSDFIMSSYPMNIP